MGIWPNDIDRLSPASAGPWDLPVRAWDFGPANSGPDYFPRPFFIGKNFSFVEIFKNAWR
jgi:hypothetical protein